jgi:hypothetical protein
MIERNRKHLTITVGDQFLEDIKREMSVVCQQKRMDDRKIVNNVFYNNHKSTIDD